MKNKKLLIIAGCGVLVAAAAVTVAVVLSHASRELPAVGSRPESIGERDFLSVSGSSLVNRDGERVVLKGTNLGSWLLQECWMSPVIGADGEWGNLDTIEALKAQGYTDDQVQKLFDTYQDNWITEHDLDIIAESGANCVRVPFWYRNFMTDEQGTWIDADLDNNPGFKRLDWVIRQAGERGMYVILDMHGCPGGQSMNHSTGTVGRNDLYSSATCRATMKKLWQAIALRYKDEPAVAAYDIMNEPQNNGGFEDRPNFVDAWDTKAWSQTNDVYREVVAAVREVDPDHIISVEGIWRITNLPDPKSEGWTNMLYQVHMYDDTAQFKQLAREVADYADRRGVAVLVGEFSNLQGIDICDELGISWLTWTYKGGKGANGSWFWYYGSPTPVVPKSDDFDTALEKWGDAIRTENFFRSSTTCGTIERALKPAEDTE